jgi:hypothetical protein
VTAVSTRRFVFMKFQVKFVLIIDNTVHLMKHFNKKKTKLELEIWYLSSSTQENLKVRHGMEG